MAFKFGKYHRDYLFWIYPLIILGLIIFAVNRDNHYKESAVSTDIIFNADSSISMSTQYRMVDSLRMTEYNDNILVLNATPK